jgi:deoxyribonuclease-4
MWTAIERGRADGCEAVQIFARSSQQWRARPLLDEELSSFRSEQADVGWPTLTHASYLINIASADPVVLGRSMEALEDEMLYAEELGIDGVVLHPGAHMGLGEPEGLKRATRSLSTLMARTRGFRARLVLELTAGQGSCLGCRVEHLQHFLEETRGGERPGICVDTCHAHAAGYDLVSDQGYAALFDDLIARVGLPALTAFHLNDSKTRRGSRVDRHEEIGDGHLGLAPFWRLVNDPRFRGVPGILETPSGPDGRPSFARNLQRLRALIGVPRPQEPAGTETSTGAPPNMNSWVAPPELT